MHPASATGQGWGLHLSDEQHVLRRIIPKLVNDWIVIASQTMGSWLDVGEAGFACTGMRAVPE